MASGITLILVKGSKQYDISQLVESIKWSGKKGGSARSITASIIDDNGHGHDRSGINVEAGHHVIFKYDGEELFRGIIMQQTQTSKHMLTFKAYDNGIYLANNKDTFNYKKKTADQIFKDVCKRYSISTGTVAKCSHKIAKLTKSKTTAWDTICDALAADYKATKTRHYVTSKKGKLSLLKRKENVLVWVLETGGNILSYSYTRSIEDVHTRIKLLSKKGKVAATQKDTALEKKIGVFQGIEKLTDSHSKAAIKKLAKSMLAEQKKPERSLKVEALGIPSVISGIGVYILVEDLGLSRVFYVDADTHTFKGRKHTMSLTLTYADDFEYD